MQLCVWYLMPSFHNAQRLLIQFYTIHRELWDKNAFSWVISRGKQKNCPSRVVQNKKFWIPKHFLLLLLARTISKSGCILLFSNKYFRKIKRKKLYFNDGIYWFERSAVKWRETIVWLMPNFGNEKTPTQKDW